MIVLSCAEAKDVHLLGCCPVCVLRINGVQVLTTYFCTIYFNTNLQCVSKYMKLFLTFGFTPTIFHAQFTI